MTDDQALDLAAHLDRWRNRIDQIGAHQRKDQRGLRDSLYGIRDEMEAMIRSLGGRAPDGSVLHGERALARRMRR